mmetsp:Transcript_16611/g.34554  ORF Transcript_16611/g.34554 Transcript_16611/m.34554 type:complete len:118 (-) Transcript_16611:11-364(-)
MASKVRPMSHAIDAMLNSGGSRRKLRRVEDEKAKYRGGIGVEFVVVKAEISTVPYETRHLRCWIFVYYTLSRGGKSARFFGKDELRDDKEWNTDESACLFLRDLRQQHFRLRIRNAR